MAQHTAQVRADFDRLALLEERFNWSHNDRYHGHILASLPANCDDVLEIGCGTGTLAREIARRSGCVLGLDLSPEMVRIAREKSKEYKNLEFRLVDVLKWDWSEQAFDCIVSVATLHHMALDAALNSMKKALRPGGRLIVVDLYRASTPGDYLTSVVAFPVNLALKLRHTGGLRTPPEVQKAWDEHGRTDHYLTIPQVKLVCRDMLPGAKITRHLLWRYSIVWQKD